MTYATVMASLALDQPNDACLAIAGDLAERFDAHVIGVAASEFSPPLYFTSGEAAQQLIDEGDASIRKRLSELEARFREAMKQRSRPAEWRCALQFPARYVAQEARAADIIVTGRGGDNVLSDPFEQAGANDLVMQAGRPMLIVPDAVRRLDLRRCLVAWKDTPEARRAVADALPMLRKAENVTIAEIVEDGGGRSAALTRVRDVAAWLARHGITASEVVPDEIGDATTQLERVASDIGASIVVAGAYGHSRFREWVFGGVTKQLFAQTDRCSMVSR